MAYNFGQTINRFGLIILVGHIQMLWSYTYLQIIPNGYAVNI